MISEAGLARVLDATPWEVAHTIHPHPSLSEAIGEATCCRWKSVTRIKMWI